MAFDGLFTTAMVQELQVLKNGRISKIHQPNAQEVVFLDPFRRQESQTSHFDPFILFTSPIDG